MLEDEVLKSLAGRTIKCASESDEFGLVLVMADGATLTFTPKIFTSDGSDETLYLDFDVEPPFPDHL